MTRVKRDGMRTVSAAESPVLANREQAIVAAGIRAEFSAELSALARQYL